MGLQDPYSSGFIPTSRLSLCSVGRQPLPVHICFHRQHTRALVSRMRLLADPACRLCCACRSLSCSNATAPIPLPMHPSPAYHRPARAPCRAGGCGHCPGWWCRRHCPGPVSGWRHLRHPMRESKPIGDCTSIQLTQLPNRVLQTFSCLSRHALCGRLLVQRCVDVCAPASSIPPVGTTSVTVTRFICREPFWYDSRTRPPKYWRAFEAQSKALPRHLNVSLPPPSLSHPAPHSAAQLYPSCATQFGIGNCCSQGGSSTCGCIGTFCRFRRVIQSPVVWEATFNKQRCVCV